MVAIWFLLSVFVLECKGDEVFGCGGFLKSNYSINYSKVEVKLYTKQGSLKYQTDCAPNNGYYLIPVYDKGHFILRIEPPVGWKFHPSSFSLHIDGKTDLCSQNKDINFVFMGFTVFGKVISGMNIGPAGIKLTLENSDGKVLQILESKNEGFYSFSPVLPGHYCIKGSHDRWLFDQQVEEFDVVDDNVETRNNIVIAGFDVRGNVASEGEPVQGVNFLLFSNEKSGKMPKECNSEKISSTNQDHDGYYLCHATSTLDGSFVFPCVPPGIYILVPSYKGEHIKFDVSPPRVQFEVEQQSYIFKESFQVQGFSVSGQVLTNAGGKGISDAKIVVNGKVRTTTNSHGIYHLENMRTGSYNVSVIASSMLFDPIIQKITPNTPRLPDIYATRYLICSQIQIDKQPPAAMDIDRFLIIKYRRDEVYSKVLPDQSGMFCSYVHPGEYIVEPSVSPKESNSGLKFSPPQYKVNISDSPVLNIVFTQFLAVVTGKVKCIERCGSLIMRISSADAISSNNTRIMETKTSIDGKFNFKECLPGKYLLTVFQKDWCFEAESRKFEVVDKNITDLELIQSGFQAAVVLSHSSVFKVKYPSGQMHSLQLQNAKSSLCLPEPGIYHFTPVGCHLFESDMYQFDTNQPKEIKIISVKHLVSGAVMAELNVSDVKILVSKSINNSTRHLLLEKPIEKINGVYKYVFSVFVEPYSDLQIMAISSQMLFYPLVAHVKMLDDCIHDAVEFVGRKGLFIHGSVKPALGNVSIGVVDKKSGKKIAETSTHANGSYTVGPLDSEGLYTITAEKLGYFFITQEPFTDFTSHKLAEITIYVTLDDRLPLSGVLLSLSGGKDYRKNSLTSNNGKVTFSSLGPGQYFIRPMLKEFQFHPPAKMVEVKEGMQIEIKISGKRVAYSMFGVVTSPTGESEVGVVIEASGIGGECQQYQEEAVSEERGLFRIRGLHPKCKYNIHLRKDADVNQHIMRATPHNVFLKVKDTDITGVNIIVFRHFSQVSVSGNIIAKQEYLHTLRVKMYNVDAPDQVLHSINLSKSGFFFLPSIILDGKFYTIQLDSSLPSGSYSYEEQSITFCANTSFLHYTFTFEPHLKPADQEIAQGSILALPVSILFGVIIYNHVAVLKLASSFFNVLIGVVYYHSASSGELPGEITGVRRRLKPRKMN